MKASPTLEQDVVRLLQEEVRRSGKGVGETLNDLLRRALNASRPRKPSKRLSVTGPFASGVIPEYTGKTASEIEAELGARAFIELQRRSSMRSAA